jgi:predicted AlkP superfamily phosphohydrolase/phosphomutase
MDAILPLAEQGSLPFFSRLLEEGSHGRLSSLHPTRRAPLWTTLASGRLPYQHGVVGQMTFADSFLGRGRTLTLLPMGIQFELWGARSSGTPIDARSLKVLRLWDIFSRLDLTAATVGWPLTSPASDGPSLNLPELYFLNGDDQHVWPAELASRARLFRPRLQELNPDLLAGFGQKGAPWLYESIVEDLWRKDISLFLLNREPGIDALFLSLPGLSRVSQESFGAYSAVQFDGLLGDEAERAAGLLANYYIFLDQILAEIWQTLPSPRLMVVASAHGVSAAKGWRGLWRQLTRRSALAGELRGSPDGVLLMLGDDIAPGVALGRSLLVDLMPTLLYGMGFPIARDLEGQVLNSAFRGDFKVRQPLSFVPSYETLEGESHPP